MLSSKANELAETHDKLRRICSYVLPIGGMDAFQLVSAAMREVWAEYQHERGL